MTNDLLCEAARARDAFRASPALMAECADVVTNWHLAQVLFAFWDCGGYDYLQEREEFNDEELCRTLGLSAQVFAPCLDYLVGHGIFSRLGNAYSLTRKGRVLHNAFMRGMIDMYVGGYRSILSRLPELLRGEEQLERLSRSVPHAASGTERINCLYTIPRVLQILEDLGVRQILDLGCGTGGFLLQACRLLPNLCGLGIDASAEAVHQASSEAQRFALPARLSFREARLGPTPLQLPTEEIAQVDCVTAMFMMHEFGRDGRDGVVAVLRALHQQFPGRKLLFVECDPLDPTGAGALPGVPLAPLDYQLVHPLSLQGAPRRKEDWWTLVEEAGGRRLRDESAWRGSFVRIYVAEL